MKANTRQDQGSTRNLRTTLSQSATPARRFSTRPRKCVHYAYKLHTNLNMQILIHSAPDTYNFDPKKCMHFPVHPALTRNPNPERVCLIPASPGRTISQSAGLPVRAFASRRLCVESRPMNSHRLQQNVGTVYMPSQN